MSTSLKPVDLTSAAVGQKYTLDFSQFVKFNPARQPYQKAHLSLFNESGCGLQLTMIASGQGQYLPAGAWTTIDLEPNDSQLTMVVVYTLPNPPVSQLGAVYFLPGEEIHGNYTLGNSPIGIGGSVNTSSVQTLSQEGQAKTVLTIDIGDSTLAQLITINNDGTATWKVDVAGVAHTIFQVLAAANFFKIGQAGDTTEVLGALKIDQGLEVAGALTADVTELVTGVLTATSAIINTINSQAATDFTQNVPTGQRHLFQVNSVDILRVIGAGLQLNSGSMSLPDGGGISGLFAIGPVTIAQAGTSVTHNMGVKPTFVVPVHDTGGQNGDVITINFGTMNTTTFTAYTTNAAGTGNVRFLIYH